MQRRFGTLLVVHEAHTLAHSPGLRGGVWGMDSTDKSRRVGKTSGGASWAVVPSTSARDEGTERVLAPGGGSNTTYYGVLAKQDKTRKQMLIKGRRSEGGDGRTPTQKGCKFLPNLQHPGVSEPSQIIHRSTR